MSAPARWNVDMFPCGCLAISAAREVLFANSYVTQALGRPAHALLGESVATILTPASLIFCDCYVFPMLLATGACDEVLLTVRAADGRRIPVIANMRSLPDPVGATVWSLFVAENRDKLYEELVVARARLERQKAQLQAAAFTDALTGLMNRRAFDLGIEAAFADADRAGAGRALALLDIDHFKALNDGYGHQHGDAALRLLGAAFAETCRANETVARYGGEEFVFSIDDAEAQGALAFAARMHGAAASLELESGPLTVSIGICLRPHGSALGYEQALAHADAALYAAKAQGRNRTVLAGV
jgi:diguanylate cyclase (GGDEF)-like protein